MKLKINRRVKFRLSCFLLGAGLLLLCIVQTINTANGQVPKEREAASGCENATLSFKGDTGIVTICSAASAAAPAVLQRLSTLAKQSEKLDQIEDFVKEINKAGHLLDKRVNAFAEKLNIVLENEQGRSDAQLMRDVEMLTMQLQDIRERIDTEKQNPASAAKVQTAIAGPVGDAIAQLDLTKARDLLEDIRVQLHDIKGDTSAILGTLKDQEELRKKADNDPNLFARATMYGNKNAYTFGGKWRLMSTIVVSHPFIDPTLRIAFRGNGRAWVVNVVERMNAPTGGDYWQFTTEELGDTAVACLAGNDTTAGTRRQWTQKFAVRQSGTMATFASIGEPTLTPGETPLCDGVTEVREAATDLPSALAPGQKTAEQRAQEIMAKSQQQMNDMLAQAAKNRETDPRLFGRISVSATRKDNSNGGNWLLEVTTAPARIGQTYYDVNVQVALKSAENKVRPVQLSNREIFVNMESRYAWVDNLGTEAVVCYTARDPSRPGPMRMTQWFTVETRRVMWTDQQPPTPGGAASFVPSKPAALAPASNAACQ